MRKLFLLAYLCFCGFSNLLAENIQWNSLLLPGEVNHVAKDSTEKTLSIFKARLFLFDSLQSIARETGASFFEHAYFADFKKPQEANHIIIDFNGASRLMYYIKLYDEQNEPHTVYNYGAVHACDPQVKTMLLTVAHTAYKVKRVEIGTFQGTDDLIKVGISGEPDGNKVLQELVRQRYSSICNKASFFTDKILLSGNVNSESYEVKPVISPDGKTLYFHRQNHKENSGGKKDDQDIYVSKFSNNEWSAAKNVNAPLNDNMPNGVASVSSGETTLFLINEYLSPNQQQQGLSYSEKTLSGWSFPKKIEVQNFYNRSEYIDYFISPTQNEMILAIQRDDSNGDQDLYVSFYDDFTNAWTEPLNLGPEINSMVSETSPFLAADGKTLYFASNGFLGYGGFDIFVTRRLDDSWTNWSFPENLGPVINTFDDDLYYTVSAAGDQAYFVSTSNGDRNIFTLPLPTIYKPEAVVLLSGIVYNSGTLLPEDAEIKIRWHGDDDVIGSGKSDPLTGEYKLVLPAGGVYDYSIEKDGFRSTTGTISTMKTKNYEEKVQHVSISDNQLRESSAVIAFEPADSITWPEVLHRVINFTRTFPDVKLLIEGAIDDSTARPQFATASGMAEYLKSAGISEDRIQSVDSVARNLSVTIQHRDLTGGESAEISNFKGRSVAEENTDIAVMIKGTAIDAETFRPVGVRLVFRNNDKVKSRSTADPVTGRFQTVVPANTQYDIAVYSDSSESHYTYRTPNVLKYQEVSMSCVVNRKELTKASFTLGTGINVNLDEKSAVRFQKYLKKKKATRELLSMQNTASPLPARFVDDLTYLAENLRLLPDVKINVVTHRASRVNASFEEVVAKRCIDFLASNGITDERIKAISKGDTEPKSAKPASHLNNRIVIEILYP